MRHLWHHATLSQYIACNTHRCLEARLCHRTASKLGLQLWLYTISVKDEGVRHHTIFFDTDGVSPQLQFQLWCNPTKFNERAVSDCNLMEWGLPKFVSMDTTKNNMCSCCGVGSAEHTPSNIAGPDVTWPNAREYGSASVDLDPALLRFVKREGDAHDMRQFVRCLW